MPEYSSPGVYVEESDEGSKSVEGVSTSTAGFLGPTERGPVEPRLVTSYAAFERRYGTSPDGSNLDAAVAGFFDNGGGRCYVGRVTAAETPATATLTDDDGDPVATVTAAGPGEWAESVAVVVEDCPRTDEDSTTFQLRVRYWDCAVETVADPGGSDPRPTPAVEEVHEDLTPDRESSQFYGKQLGSSVLVDVDHEGDGRPAGGLTWLDRDRPTGVADGGAVPADLGDRDREALQSLAEGTQVEPDQSAADIRADLRAVREESTDDGSRGGGADLTLADYRGEDAPGHRTGLAGLQQHDDISLVCVPDENDVTGLTDAVVTHCERMGDRFAVLQAPQCPGPVSDIEPPVDSSYAGYYYPWLSVADPDTGTDRLVPPGGHVAGIIARSDAEHGVHKAPANETVRGALGLQHDLTKGEQDLLNPRGVNCIRSFQGRGIRLWGARTTSSDPSWKYINVRRLFLYVEQSIDEGTQWAVFEPNDRDLWARVRQSVENFLTTVWRDGGLMGSTAEEAFYVECGEQTMTQDDVDNGRLIVEIGIAPVKPAEFVVFRISQWTNDS
jgi:phage tail sheath protein FI